MSDPDALPVFHVIGFTGHRHVADLSKSEAAIAQVLREFQATTGSEWVGLSSIAEGSDVVFARSVLSLNMGWEAILPFSPAEFRSDFEPEQWREVEVLLAKAEAVRTIGIRQDREDAYLDCGMEVVRRCDVLLALWDGLPARGRGGTAEIVAYARKIGRPLVIIDSATSTPTRENLERIRFGDRHIEAMNRLPLPGSPEVVPEADPALRAVQSFHRRVDAMATHHAPHFRRLTATTIGLHVLATALAAAGLSFDLHGSGLPWGKLACLLGALGVALLLREKRDRHDWVRCRLAAEITRSALATWGLPRSLRLLDGMDWEGLELLRRPLDILQRRAVRNRPVSLSEFKRRYVVERIEAQLAYFGRHERRAAPLLRRLRAGFFIATVLAIVCTATYAGYSSAGAAAPAWLGEWVFNFGPIVLPVLAAAFVSLIAVNDLHRRTARYREMRVRLETVRSEIEFSRTWGSLELIVAKAERALLQEVFEWHSITSFSESH